MISHSTVYFFSGNTYENMLSITGVIASFSSSSPNVKEGDNYTVTVSLDKSPGRLIGFIIETIPLSATSMYVC